jgi:hypothetical protein
MVMNDHKKSPARSEGFLASWLPGNARAAEQRNAT